MGNQEFWGELLNQALAKKVADPALADLLKQMNYPITGSQYAYLKGGHALGPAIPKPPATEEFISKISKAKPPSIQPTAPAIPPTSAKMPTLLKEAKGIPSPTSFESLQALKKSGWLTKVGIRRMLKKVEFVGKRAQRNFMKRGFSPNSILYPLLWEQWQQHEHAKTPWLYPEEWTDVGNGKYIRRDLYDKRFGA